MRGRGLLLLLAGLLLAGLGWLGWRQLPWEQVEVPAGYQGEARSNPFLAAQRLLVRTGHRAVCGRGLPDPLPPPGDVLILPSRQGTLAPAAAARIADWVARGGLLLAAGMEPEPARARATADPLFRAFGVRLVAAPVRPGAASFALDGARFQLDLGGRARIQAPAGADGPGPAGPDPLVRVRHGRGEALLAADLWCLSNRRLQTLDHPDFLCAVAGQRPDGQVWIITGLESPSLWGWLRVRAWPVLAALAALLLAGFRAAAPRFGPPIPDPDPARRSLLEHLDACGRYQWRSGRGEPLLRAARAAMRQRLGQVHPGWLLLDPPELRLRLAQASGLDPERIQRALHSAQPHPAGFLEAIQTLHRLRRAL